jgi:hypothetical protein
MLHLQKKPAVWHGAILKAMKVSSEFHVESYNARKEAQDGPVLARGNPKHRPCTQAYGPTGVLLPLTLKPTIHS